MSEMDKQKIRRLEAKLAKAQMLPPGEKVNRINLNTLAKDITLKEKGKQQISIAQVKEVMKVMLKELNKYNNATIIDTVRRYE